MIYNKSWKYYQQNKTHLHTSENTAHKPTMFAEAQAPQIHSLTSALYS